MDNIQLTLESSTTSLSLNSDSIYLNPEIDGLAGLPEIRTTSGVNAGYNGGWTSAQFYDARLITIRGVISDSDISVVEDRRKALVGLLGQGRKEELTLHFVTAGGNSYVLNCRTISCEMALSGLARKQEFLIQLRADDPLIYDDGALATEAIVNVRRALGGFQIDFGLPLYIGGGVNETLVENGNETVYPVINLYGPLHSPTIINQTTNQQMQVLTDLDYALTWVNPVEVTGDYILVTNETDKESPLSSVELLGNTTQDTLSGKNLLRLPSAGTSSGITYSINNDGTFNLHGTNSAGYEVLFTYYIDSTEFQSTNYTLSANKALPDGAAVRLEIYRDTTWKRSFVTVNNSRQSQTATPDFTGANRVRVAVCVGSGKTVNIDNLGVMLEKSSSVTAFEPYCGGTPAPNPTYPIAVQTTTGEQVVKMCGKNVYNATTAQTTSQALTYSGDTGYIYLNGTRTGNGGINWANGYLPAGKYKLMLELVSGSITSTASSPKGQLFYVYGANITLSPSQIALSSDNPKGSITLTVSADTTNAHINSWARTTETCTNAVIKYQIVRGEDDDYDFEPYQEQSYEVNLGKNLLDPSILEVGNITAQGVDSASTQVVRSDYIYLKAGNYVLRVNDANNQIKIFRYVIYDTSKTFVLSSSPVAKQTTITMSADGYLRLCFYNDPWRDITVNEIVASNIQLELGSTATDYAPYFTPIELCKLGTYQDKIYKSGDDWYVHKAVGRVVLDGSISPDAVNISSTNTARFLWNGLLSPVASCPSADRLNSKCDHFVLGNNWGNDNVGIYFDEGQTGNTWFRVNKSIATTSAGITTWLANNPVALYYTLGTTATDTQITNQALIDQLDALASSTLFVGVNNIALMPSGGAQGELTVEYFSAYTEERDIVVIDSQARTITKNGADIYYLKADGSEFPTLAPGENTLYLTSEQTSDEGYAEIKFKQGYLSI